MRAIHDDVDPGDLRALDREYESRQNPAADRPHRAGLAVDESGQRGLSTTFESARNTRCAPNLRSQLGSAVSPVHGGCMHGALVGSQYHLWR